MGLNNIELTTERQNQQRDVNTDAHDKIKYLYRLDHHKSCFLLGSV